MDASRQQFACANPEKSDKTKTRISEIIQENESKLEFNKTKSHPLPHSILVSVTWSYGSTCSILVSVTWCYGSTHNILVSVNRF